MRTLPFLPKNQAAKGNNWIGMKLEGVTCNRDAVGAKIVWTVAGKRFSRLKNGCSYLSSDDPLQTFKYPKLAVFCRGPSL